LCCNTSCNWIKGIACQGFRPILVTPWRGYPPRALGQYPWSHGRCLLHYQDSVLYFAYIFVHSFCIFSLFCFFMSCNEVVTEKLSLFHLTFHWLENKKPVPPIKFMTPWVKIVFKYQGKGSSTTKPWNTHTHLIQSSCMETAHSLSASITLHRNQSKDHTDCMGHWKISHLLSGRKEEMILFDNQSSTSNTPTNS
jgi:hypothetical protein